MNVVFYFCVVGYEIQTNNLVVLPMVLPRVNKPVSVSSPHTVPLPFTLVLLVCRPSVRLQCIYSAARTIPRPKESDISSDDGVK